MTRDSYKLVFERYENGDVKNNLTRMVLLWHMCREKYIELYLYLTNEVDWLSYKMMVGEMSSSERKELFRLEGEELRIFHVE